MRRSGFKNRGKPLERTGFTNRGEGFTGPRKPLARGRRRVGQAAVERRKAGGKRAIGRDSATVAGWAETKRHVHGRAGGKCECCGSRLGPFDPEHAKPRSQGGDDSPDNVWWADRRCHRAKERHELHVTPLGEGRYDFRWGYVSKHEWTKALPAREKITA